MVMIFAFLRLPTLFILLKNAERKSIFSANQIKPYYFLMGHNILWHYQRFTISHWIFSVSTRIGFSCHHFWTCFTFVITCFTFMYHFLHYRFLYFVVFIYVLLNKYSIIDNGISICKTKISYLSLLIKRGHFLIMLFYFCLE